MKKFPQSYIENVCGYPFYVRGAAYYREGNVYGLKVNEMSRVITAKVEGQRTYEVNLYPEDEGKLYSMSCTCMAFEEYGRCKHIAAVMLAYNDLADNEDEALTEYSASGRAVKHILGTYYGKTQASTKLSSQKARLVPRISFPSGRGAKVVDYPTFTFTVGFDKLYVVKKVDEFVGNVMSKATVAYGKKLTLYHGIEQFDEPSQRLIGLLMNQFNSSRSYMGPGSGYYCSGGNSIAFCGRDFDEFFDIYKDIGTERADVTDGHVDFSEGDPKISLSLKTQQDKTVTLSVRGDKAWKYFGNSQSLYCYNGDKDTLYKCSREFHDSVFPLVENPCTNVPISKNDLAAFCANVLPEVKSFVKISDPDSLLDKYLPDECIPKFYLDIDGDILFLKLTYGYDDMEFNPLVSQPGAVIRDTRKEQEARWMVEKYFTLSGEQYILTGDDKIFDFLSDGISRLHTAGEVYISDRLKNKQLSAPKATVGLSVSGGILNLDVDIGDYPPEELEDLYQSLIKKKRYHKLKDGRFLALDGSACETLAEMSHMLRLKPEEIAGGEIKMPAFRCMYLDNLLSGADDIQVRRDKQFKAMIRNFKSVEDGDYTLPPQMEEILRPYQKLGFQWLKTLESCGFGGILADEMGLGKTLQMIAYFLTCTRAQVGAPSLVVCPASLILNWKDEFSRFAPEERVLVVMGPAAERKKLIADIDNFDVCVTSYELLRQDIELYRTIPFYCCTLDEAQHIKNSTTLASKAVKQIDCRQRFVLTGTPIENRLSEIWNLFDFLMPGYLFTHSVFVEKLEKPIIKSEDSQAAEQLRKLVRPFLLRRFKKDVLKELPDKVERVHRIPLSEKEREVYMAAALNAKNMLSANPNESKIAVLAALTRLRQICCAPELCFENYNGPDSKLDACIDLCSGLVENGHQILLFSQFTSMLEMIEKRLNACGISNFTLRGSTSKEKRAELVKDFNNGGASVFLISLKAGGTGLNLTAADVVIHYDPWWNQAAQDQATDRAHRIGQRQSVQVYKLIAQDTIEEKIVELQGKKAMLLDAVSGDNNGDITHMSQEELLELLG